MRFMMIVKSTKDYETACEANPELAAAMQKHASALEKQGILLSVGGLFPSSQGARVRVSGQKVTVTDGPFAETRELMGGFAILKANSKEEAVEMGRQFMQIHADVLGSDYVGEMEVRQMRDEKS
jgi:hypothetical protein